MQATLKKLRTVLTPLYGKGEAEAMIRLIFHALKGWTPTDMAIHATDTISDIMTKKIDCILVRLIGGEPIQYILGEAYFHGMDLKVGPGVLIPRPETEQLVDMIIDDADGRADLQVLDIGTGSGCIAIALARNLRFPQVSAIDISSEALEYAEKNAALFKARIHCIKKDILSLHDLPNGPYDIIVSNPPYITESEKEQMEHNVLDFEPHSALFVPNSNPLLFYSKIATLALDGLKPDGRLYFEINPLQCSRLMGELQGLGYRDVEAVKDYCGRQRFIKCLHS